MFKKIVIVMPKELDYQLRIRYVLFGVTLYERQIDRSAAEMYIDLI